MMTHTFLASVAVLTWLVSGQMALEDVSKTCKNPTVEQRRMADDVRYASPFYVLALPRTPRTELIDNVCYTYYENKTANSSFFHIMSIVYKNQTNSYNKLSKQDILDRNGLAEARGEVVSSCTYHDHTLVPICNSTVFILYRCFIEGDCKDADIEQTAGVDVRVVLAASTTVSQECKQEIETSLRDTSVLAGGDYVILPQALKPQCITSFGNRQSINHDKALGSISINEENINLNRFGGDEQVHDDVPSSSLPLNSAQFLTQYTPLTDVPKKTYAEAVKSSKITISEGKNIIHYDEKLNHNYKDSCSCS